MQERVYRTKVRDIEHLRLRIVQVWDELDQRVIDASVKQKRTRLRAPFVLQRMVDILNINYE